MPPANGLPGRCEEILTGKVAVLTRLDKPGKLIYNLANVSNGRLLVMKNFCASVVILSNLLLTLVIGEGP